MKESQIIGGDCIKVSKIGRLVLGTIFALSMSVSGYLTFAETMTTLETKSTSTSAVNIDIVEYMDNGTQQVEYVEQTKSLMPGDRVSLIPKVLNYGADCYIRAKIDVKLDGQLVNTEDYIKGIPSSFNKIEDYYYYPDVVEAEEAISIFDSVQIPQNLGNEYQGKSLVVEVTAEAIQAKNFEPGDEEWEIIVDENINKHYSIGDDVEPVKSIIKYENGAQEYINVPSTFFSSLKNIVPGDTFSDFVSIQDVTKDSKFTLRIEKDSPAEPQKMLLENTNITITTSQGQIIYDGNLLSDDTIVLGSYKKGDNEDLAITISLPTELGNEYSQQEVTLTWVFNGEYGKSVEPEILDNPVVPEPKDNPFTGDIKLDAYVIIFITSTIGFLSVLVVNKKESELK